MKRPIYMETHGPSSHPSTTQKSSINNASTMHLKRLSAYPPAIAELKADGVLDENSKHRPVQYLNNILEQDHGAIKRRVRASQHFRSFWGAWRTIARYEAIHMIRKGQACCSTAGAEVGLLHRFILGLFAATN